MDSADKKDYRWREHLLALRCNKPSQQDLEDAQTLDEFIREGGEGEPSLMSLLNMPQIP